ncbi:MAG: rhomboid family intramembrane serine protease [Geobacter sp.]|nr:rhomboid family intramembrane serine protease [Geobacter sp.]
MIPLRDHNPTSRPPALTILLITFNILIFVQDRLTGHSHLALVKTVRGWVEVEQFVGGLTSQYALIPANLIRFPAEQWSTIFTSMFLHGNWLHIASNMLFLWVFGDNIEDTLGGPRFLLFYYTCGCVAALTQVAAAPLSKVPMVGASGAVAGARLAVDL